jgi:hypothetical protein
MRSNLFADFANSGVKAEIADFILVLNYDQSLFKNPRDLRNSRRCPFIATDSADSTD